jgi:hypothetical protein
MKSNIIKMKNLAQWKEFIFYGIALKWLCLGRLRAQRWVENSTAIKQPVPRNDSHAPFYPLAMFSNAIIGWRHLCGYKTRWRQAHPPAQWVAQHQHKPPHPSGATHPCLQFTFTSRPATVKRKRRREFRRSDFCIPCTVTSSAECPSGKDVTVNG